MSLSFSIYLLFGCLITAVALFSTPIFKFLDSEIKEERSNSIDGMRFYLASFVIAHHLDCSLSYIKTGVWEPSSWVLMYAGKYGVAMFFMITAYLFWGKVKNADTIDWVLLYKKRFLRIAPLSLFCSLVAVLLLLSLTGIPEWSYSNTQKILSWFDAGLWDSKPQFTEMKDPWIVMAGVTWTLRWEWVFYFSLPIFFVFKKYSLELSIFLFSFSLYFLPEITSDASLWGYFFAGMVCREMKERISIERWVCNAFLALAVILTAVVRPSLFMPPEKIFMLAMFFFIAAGADMYGALTIRAVRRLGAISYSLYLTQGLVMFPAFMLIKKSFTGESEALLLFLLVAVFISTCILSSFTFKFIESPMMKLGNRK